MRWNFQETQGQENKHKRTVPRRNEHIHTAWLEVKAQSLMRCDRTDLTSRCLRRLNLLEHLNLLSVHCSSGLRCGLLCGDARSLSGCSRRSDLSLTLGLSSHGSGCGGGSGSGGVGRGLSLSCSLSRTLHPHPRNRPTHGHRRPVL
jgi:hypothetical protein